MATSPFRRSITGREVKWSPTRPTRRSVWKWRAVEADDAGRFLAAMLERMQSERRQRRGIGMVEDAEDAALLVQPVLFEPESGSLVRTCSVTGLSLLPVNRRPKERFNGTRRDEFLEP